MTGGFHFWRTALVIVLGIECYGLYDYYRPLPAKPIVIEHIIPAHVGKSARVSKVPQTAYVCSMTGSGPCLIADGSIINSQAISLSRHARLPAPPRHQ